MCCFHGKRKKRQDLKQIRESRILATSNHRISQYNPPKKNTTKQPQNKLGMKTQKKVVVTYKSTENIQRARPRDNLPSTMGTDDIATPKYLMRDKPYRWC